MDTCIESPVSPDTRHDGSAEPMRILHIFGRMDRGGAEMRTLELFRHLDPTEHRFEFCSLSGKAGELDNEILRLGGKVHLVKLSSAGFPARFRNLLTHGNFSVVHSHVHYFSGFLLRLAAKAGTPCRIAHFRTTNDGKGTSLWRQARNLVLKHWIDAYATQILGVSRAALDASLGADWNSDPRCKVIYNGIDCGPGGIERDSENVRNEFAIPTVATLLIHVGRWSPEKNHDRLLRVFSSFVKRVPNSYLLLVGAKSEPVISGVRKLVRELDLEGHAIECGSRSDVKRLLMASDLMICPSMREGLPGAVLEAAAVGTPALTSDIAPMLEVSQYLPIRTMSLLDSNEAWSAASVDLCQDSTLQSRLIRAFAASPFTMRASVAAFRQVYPVLASGANEKHA